jgi:hypothetical protein
MQEVKRTGDQSRLKAESGGEQKFHGDEKLREER